MAFAPLSHYPSLSVFNENALDGVRVKPEFIKIISIIINSLGEEPEIKDIVDLL